MKEIAFTKMVGTGNDFIMINNMENDSILSEKIKNKDFVKNLCNRVNGIGADGIILICENKKETSDFSMKIINSDGSEAEMCGNGARCALYFAYKEKIINANFTKFDTLAGEINGGIIKENEKDIIIKIKMINPHSLNTDIVLDLPNLGERKVFSINTGVPHAIVFLNETDFQNIDIKSLGKFIRYNEVFYPKGTNVDFVNVIEGSKHDIFVRTYERGVENETLSCGSGSCASAIISGLFYDNLYSPIIVHTRGGDILNVFFEKDDSSVKNVYLEGKVKVLYKGFFDIDNY